jgi:PTH1 family peptidyl-tRNA hydrolase
LSSALVVGLGNPGEKYRDTRHNLGFEVALALSRAVGAGAEQDLCGALVASAAGEQLLIARPQTYMNRSGFALRCLVERFAIELDRVLVVYDDVSLPLGRLRLRPEGGPGGHRGMESVIENLRSSKVARLRLGILPNALDGEPESGVEVPPRGDLAEFVLAPFDASERTAVEDLVRRAAEAAQVWSSLGVAEAMNRFNR